MELLLTRQVRTEISTIGELTVEGQHQCFVLEDKDRGLRADMPLTEINQHKVHGKTAIPAGRYQVVITMSTRFERLLPLLVNVPGYAGVRIHPGNFAGDTEGCLLPGRQKATDKVTESRLAFNDLYPKIQAAIAAGNKVFITIQ